MIRKNSLFAAFLAVTLFVGISAVAAQKQPEKTAKATSAEKESVTQTGYKLGKSELFSGTITSVDTAASTVTLTSRGVSYVFRLTGKAQIRVNGNNVALETLSEHIGHNASIHFVPYSKGNFADHFEVSTT